MLTCCARSALAIMAAPHHNPTQVEEYSAKDVGVLELPDEAERERRDKDPLYRLEHQQARGVAWAGHTHASARSRVVTCTGAGRARAQAQMGLAGRRRATRGARLCACVLACTRVRVYSDP